MRRRIHLHGSFAVDAPSVVEVVADTVWEAVEAISRQIPAFRPDLQGKKRVVALGFDTVESLRSPTEVEDIHLLPAMSFGKNNGLVNVIVGTVLMVVAVAMGGVFWPTLIASAGISMFVGGVVAMLTPQPKMNTDDPTIQSKYLPSSQNTVKIGTHIGILYGLGKIGGQILSLEIVSKEAA